MTFSFLLPSGMEFEDAVKKLVACKIVASEGPGGAGWNVVVVEAEPLATLESEKLDGFFGRVAPHAFSAVAVPVAANSPLEEIAPMLIALLSIRELAESPQAVAVSLEARFGLPVAAVSYREEVSTDELITAIRSKQKVSVWAGRAGGRPGGHSM